MQGFTLGWEPRTHRLGPLHCLGHCHLFWGPCGTQNKNDSTVGQTVVLRVRGGWHQGHNHLVNKVPCIKRACCKPSTLLWKKKKKTARTEIGKQINMVRLHLLQLLNPEIGSMPPKTIKNNLLESRWTSQWAYMSVGNSLLVKYPKGLASPKPSLHSKARNNEQ